MLIADQPTGKEATSEGYKLMKKWVLFGSVMGFLLVASMNLLRLKQSKEGQIENK